jgi:TetR/AcrR family transcriptional regulator, transcriptional repressor for nem operon
MKRVRNPEQTRARLLEAGFLEIYKHGFQAASIDRILKHTSVTKGAFFHHFRTKKALGYAVVDEVIARMIADQWEVPLRDSTDPMATILQSFETGVRVLEAARPNLGCPLNNLAQEMSPIDSGFQKRTERVFKLWTDTFATAIRRAVKLGQVRKSVDPKSTALYLVAQIEGILSLAKNSQDPRVLRSGLKSMSRFIGLLLIPGR